MHTLMRACVNTSVCTGANMPLCSRTDHDECEHWRCRFYGYGTAQGRYARPARASYHTALTIRRPACGAPLKSGYVYHAFAPFFQRVDIYGAHIIRTSSRSSERQGRLGNRLDVHVRSGSVRRTKVKGRLCLFVSARAIMHACVRA